MRPHHEFWQAVFQRAVNVLKGEGLDLSGWTLRTRPANDHEADAMIKSEGGFVDSVVGHADRTQRILTLFLHDFVWDEAGVAAQVRGAAANSADAAENTAAWWLVEAMRSRCR